VFLHASNYQLEIEVGEGVPFIKAIKSIKYLRIIIKGQLYLKR
jgi:hypothetical protein